MSADGTNGSDPEAPDFRHLFEASPALALALTPDLSIVAASDSYLSALGMSRDHVLGRSFFDAFPQESAAAAEALRVSFARVQSTLSVDVTEPREHHIADSEGGAQTRLRISRNIPLLNAAGRLMTILHCIEDVTAAIEYQHAQQEAVRAATALDESRRALELFTHSVAHDLRSPVLAVGGLSEALLEDYADAVDTTGKEYLTFIRNSAQRLALQIEGLEALSRVERADFQRQPVDLSAIARTAIDHIRSEHPDRRATVSIQDALEDQGDPRLLNLLLHHLFHNAWKFSRTRDETEIAFGRAEDAGRRSYFVRDNGVGFDMEYAERLFGMFQRMHLGDAFEGLGVGLAAVSRIVTRHGGRVWADAAVDRGASFYFTLNEPDRFQPPG